MCLTSRMSRLAGAWFSIGSQVLVLRVLGFLLIFLVIFGLDEGRGEEGRGHLDDDVGGDSANRSCRGCCSVPGPLQTVQRAEVSGDILALQAADGVHLGVDNLGVVRHVGRLLDGNLGSCPAELVNDGGLILLIGRMLEMRGRDTVLISKVKGCADGDVVREGRAREPDRIGNNAAGVAAIDARRNFAGVCGRWYPVVLELHPFFLAISRAVVNHEDESVTAPGPLVWSAGALPKRRRLVHAAQDHAFLPGPTGI